jgi:hypothetical protein
VIRGVPNQLYPVRQVSHPHVALCNHRECNPRTRPEGRHNPPPCHEALCARLYRPSRWPRCPSLAQGIVARIRNTNRHLPDQFCRGRAIFGSVGAASMRCPSDLAQPIITAALHRKIARRLWRNAPTLPKAERLKALRNAELHAGLARALDENPNLAAPDDAPR